MRNKKAWANSIAAATMKDESNLKWSAQLQNGIYEDDKITQKMQLLPHDLIVFEILVRLPIKSLIRFKSVSKKWYSSVSSPHFAIAHFNFSRWFYRLISPIHCVFVQSGDHYFLFSCDEHHGGGELDDNIVNKGMRELCKLDDAFDGTEGEIFVIGSCNGLVCLVSLLGYLIIWNPIIHQWVKFSCPFGPMEEPSNTVAWGFGYESTSDDYKVVRLDQTNQPKEIVVQVFSLKTQIWVQIHDQKLRGYSFGSMSESPRLAGALVDETLYWIMNKVEGGNGQYILGLDLVHEKFVDNIHVLVQDDSYLSRVSFLCKMGGYLSMCRFTNRGDVSISILKENGQVEYMGIYRDMNLSSCSALVGYTPSGEVFIQVRNQELGLVDLKSSPKLYTQLVKFEGESRAYIDSYVPSLVSPLQYCVHPRAI